jgi:hypothetical protein
MLLNSMFRVFLVTFADFLDFRLKGRIWSLDQEMGRVIRLLAAISTGLERLINASPRGRTAVSRKTGLCSEFRGFRVDDGLGVVCEIFWKLFSLNQVVSTSQSIDFLLPTNFSYLKSGFLLCFSTSC